LFFIVIVGWTDYGQGEWFGQGGDSERLERFGNGNRRCQTVSGGTVGVDCVIPFNYHGKRYNGCTIADASDGKLWCSVEVDSFGNHIGDRGLWGHCNDFCSTDFSKLNAGKQNIIVLREIRGF
jgi:hypothetical protein